MKILSSLKKAITLFVVSINLFCNGEEKPMVVLVCSYNNAPWVIKNLDSIFNQKYENFRVVYLDDCSSDGTADAVMQYVTEHNLEDKFTMIQNDSRCRKMKNLYTGFYLCDDDEIVVFADGDDWFSRTNVFAEINKAYSDPNVWLTYGNFRRWPSNALGHGREVSNKVKQDRSFRKLNYFYTMPRTCYGWLPKLIHLEDLMTEKALQYKGKFIPICNDSAMMFPMLEMIGNKFKFIKNPGYIVNTQNPISTANREQYDEKELQKICHDEVFEKPIQYDKIDSPIMNRLAALESATAALIVLCTNVSNTEQFLESTYDQVKGLHTVLLLHEGQAGYDKLIAKFEGVHQIDCSFGLQNAATVLKILKPSHSVLTVDTVSVIEPIDMRACVYQLEKTFAYGFYFGLGTVNNEDLAMLEFDQVPCQHIEEDMFAWKYIFGTKENVKSLRMSLYRTLDILRVMENGNCATCNQFMYEWQNSTYNSHGIGLFKRKKCVESIFTK